MQIFFGSGKQFNNRFNIQITYSGKEGYCGLGNPCNYPDTIHYNDMDPNLKNLQVGSVGLEAVSHNDDCNNHGSGVLDGAAEGLEKREDTGMRILIVGAEAIWSLFAGKLAGSGIDVYPETSNKSFSRAKNQVKKNTRYSIKRGLEMGENQTKFCDT